MASFNHSLTGFNLLHQQADPLVRDEEGGLPQTLWWDIFGTIFLVPKLFSWTDAKKSVWVPDGEGGFDEAMIDTVDGDKVNVKVGWEPKTFKSAQVMQVNPPKMASDFLSDERFSLISF